MKTLWQDVRSHISYTVMCKGQYCASASTISYSASTVATSASTVRYSASTRVSTISSSASTVSTSASTVRSSASTRASTVSISNISSCSSNVSASASSVSILDQALLMKFLIQEQSRDDLPEWLCVNQSDQKQGKNVSLSIYSSYSRWL